MVGIFVMAQWKQFLIFWKQEGQCNYTLFLATMPQPSRITLQISVLMIEYLLATSYELSII